MCLSRVTKTIEKPTDKIVKVWKSFGVSYTTRELFTRWDRKTVKLGVWLKARRRTIDSNQGKQETCRSCGHTKHVFKTYMTGFHAYARRRKGINDIPVEFRKVRTIGKQSGRVVIVADEMRVPKDWRKYLRSVGRKGKG